MPKTLCVVAPVYNEEEVVGAFYDELRDVLDGLGDAYRSTIVFVVDRSTDATLDVLKAIAQRDARVRIIAMSSRFGHQMSLLAGIDHSDADAVIMLDSDLQHPPALIPQLLAEFEKGHDVVFTLRRDAPDVSWLKRSSSKLFYRIINSISDVQINESAADFRLISRRVAAVVRTRIRERNQFLRGLFGWIGFKSIAIPFDARRRGAGRSKYSLARMVRFGIHGVVSFSKTPLQAAVLTGLGFAAGGFLFTLVVVFQYCAYRSFPSGWATLAILVSTFSGVQLIFLGIIGEYIGAIFDEVKARPHYIVDELINFDGDG